jgi:putative Holliday junction resolvase
MQNSIPNFDFKGKKILAIDYGEKVTGLAYFFEGVDLFPYSFGKIIMKDQTHFLGEIQKIVKSEEIDAVVLGVPTFLDGKESRNTLKIKKIGQSLIQLLRPIPVFFQDETLSTREAMSRMQSSPRYNFKIDYEKIDEVSAIIILEDFIRKTL